MTNEKSKTPESKTPKTDAARERAEKQNAATKKQTKMSYKKTRAALMDLVDAGLKTLEQAETELAKLVELGKVSDPSKAGGGAKETSAEALLIRNAVDAVLKENKEAVDILKARGIIPVLYFKGANPKSKSNGLNFYCFCLFVRKKTEGKKRRKKPVGKNQ